MGRRNRLCGSRVARSRRFALLRPRIRAAVGLDRAIREPLIAITTATRSSPLTTRGDGGIVEFSSTVAGPQPLHIDRCGAHESAAQATIHVLWIRSLADDGVSRDDRRRAEPDSRGSMSASRPASALHGHRRADSKSTRRSAQSRHNTNRHESPFWGSSLDFVDRGDDQPEPIAIRGAASCSAMRPTR